MDKEKMLAMRDNNIRKELKRIDLSTINAFVITCNALTLLYIQLKRMGWDEKFDNMSGLEASHEPDVILSQGMYLARTALLFDDGSMLE